MVTGTDGPVIPLNTLHEGDFIGQTALTREPVTGNAYAVGEVTMLRIERKTLEQLVFRKPDLLRISVRRSTNAANGPASWPTKPNRPPQQRIPTPNL